MADALTVLSFLSYWVRLSHNPDDQEKLVHLSLCFVHEMQLPQSSSDDLTAAAEVLVPEKYWITTFQLKDSTPVAPKQQLCL